MSDSARGPGVLLSVRWGDQDLAHEFFRLGAPRTFTIGTSAKCDFACGGAKSFPMLEIDEEGAALQAPKNAGIQVTRHGNRWATQGEPVRLERGDHAQFGLGPLTFEAKVLDAPPAVDRGGVFEFTTVNFALVLAAAFGLFTVAAANRDAEGADLDDELHGHPARAVKILNDRSVRQAGAAAAAPNPQKTKPTGAAPSRARQQPPPRPTLRPQQQLVDVGSIFRGPGALKLLTGGLGKDLLAATSGIRTAQAGDGLGGLGAGKGLDGNGLGGLFPEGIGTLGTHGGHGRDKYGVGVALTTGPKQAPKLPDDPTVEGCAVDGAGCLDKELIRRVIHQNLGSYRYCYESLLNRFPTLEGKVSVRFSIAQSGKVPAADVAQSTANNAELEHCVSNRTRLLQFPARRWTGMVVVTYPFIFKQGGK